MEGHSPEFIQEMKQRLMEEQAQLRKDLQRLGHKEHGDYQADFDEYGRDDEANAMEIADHQAQASTTDTIEERLKEVEEALERIEQGKYGVTDEGELIPENRLRANPAANTLVKPA